MPSINYNYLTKHIDYIDYYINRIKNVYSRNNSILPIKKIIKAILEIKDNLFFSDDIRDSVDKLKLLFSRWDIINDGDFAGYIYQELQVKDAKNKKGQYFTPPKTVEYMLQRTLEIKIENIEKVKILDPSCGSGQFLISSFLHLLSLYKLKGYSTKNASQLIIKNNLHGFDIDKTALLICRKNLQRLSNLDFISENIVAFDFLKKEDLFFKESSVCACSFDYIIGNPPWGSKFTITEKNYFKKNYLSAKSGINSFSLFIDRSFDFLNESGKICFLVPEALLNIKAHFSVRKLILDNSVIKEISLWGEQFKGIFAPSVSIFLEKCTDKKTQNENIISIRKRSDFLNNTETLIPQHYYQTTSENIFSINYTKVAVNILSKLNDLDCFYLKDNADFFLGIVTGNNDQHIQNTYSTDFPDPIIIGKNIEPFKVNFTENFFKYNPLKLQQSAPEQFYRTKNKILYKFIGKKLTFALEKNGYFTLNNVNGFIPKYNYMSNEALLGILNSKLVQYYYEKTFFTIKVLRGNLEKIPIKKISFSTDNLLKSMVENICLSNSENEIKKIKENIDDLIFYEYGYKSGDISKILAIN